MRTPAVALVALLLAAAPVGAQTAPAIPPPTEVITAAHVLPFASSGHTLELTLELPPAYAHQRSIAEAVEVPAGIVLHSRRLEADDAVVRFAFDVAPDAPVGEVLALRVALRTEGPQDVAAGPVVAEHVVRLIVSAPEAVALGPSRPNPAHARTRIGFTLPTASVVRLVVFDALGREVARLAEGAFAAGAHDAVWETEGVASGVYLYRLVVEGAGRPEVRQGRLLVVR